ncbi:MAG: aminoacyl-tRNA hydrolase [Bacteroidales bacterium]|nr:aminoacyl-tRNA hydrolase [Bacteroidales bacterium]
MRDCLIREVVFRTSRSSGPGGQHVNKTESRVELLWDPVESVCLDEQQKSRLRIRLKTRLTDQGILILVSDKYRSQHRNREDVTERFVQLVSKGIIPAKKRHPTRPTRASQEKRIKQKKIRGEIKRSRRSRPEE